MNRPLSEEGRELLAHPDPKPFTWPGDANLLITGKTGSGKSELLAREILPQIKKPILLIDPKHAKAWKNRATWTLDPQNPRWPPKEWWVEWREETGKWPMIRFCPDMRIPKGKDRALGYVLDNALRMGHIVVISDETVSWADANRYPPELAALEQMGREPDVHHIRINQRLKKIPDFFINQSSYFVAFWQNRADDRERLEEIGVSWEVLPYLGLYQYASYNQNDPTARSVTVHQPLTLKGGKTK